jgi:hypothetical protein
MAGAPFGPASWQKMSRSPTFDASQLIEFSIVVDTTDYITMEAGNYQSRPR